MAETPFASIDATTTFNADFEYRPDPASLARRSISIFSRRGTETPEPKPTFIAQAEVSISKPMTQRQKSWIVRSKSLCGSPVSPRSPRSPNDTPRGTVLNAVPAAQTIKMSALEEEMATSPNDEILSAISEQACTHDFVTAQSQPTTPVRAHNSLNLSALSLAHRTKSQKQRETDSRVGVWVDGVVRWDEPPRPQSFVLDTMIEEETGLTPVRPPLQRSRNSTRRPLLSVKIPGGQPRINDQTVSTVLQTRPRRPMVSVAPAGIVSQFATSKPSITISMIDDHSPEETGSTSPTTPADQPRTPTAIEIQRIRISSSSSCSSPVEEAGSVCSKRSSATSVEAPKLHPKPDVNSKRAPTSKYAVTPLAKAGDDSASPASDVNKPLPPPPAQASEPEAPSVPSIPPKAAARRSRFAKSIKTSSSRMSLKPSKEVRKSVSMSQLDACDREFMLSAPSGDIDGLSPTLSQAENELRAQLKTMTKEPGDGMSVISVRKSSISSGQSTPAKVLNIAVSRNGSVHSVMQPPERAPTIPKRSRRREWRSSKGAEDLEKLAAPVTLARRKSESEARSAERAADAKAFRRTVSIAHIRNRPSSTAAPMTSVVPLPDADATEHKPIPTIVVDDGLIVVDGPKVIRDDDEAIASVTAVSAEEVLLNILSSLNSLEDLFNMAIINKGMYRVFKENEMTLIRTVTFNESPAAWESREWSPPDPGHAVSSKVSTMVEHTPKTWMGCHNRDQAVIDSLEALVFERCALTRPELTTAMAMPAHPYRARVDDAFWRIWCFCKIFGSEKGREDDITGQLDWLKGGILANNRSCVATVNTNLDFDMSSVLLNAPEHFAKGNSEGLNPSQLLDMLEIWNCLTALLSGYLGRIDQARKYGVFDNTDVPEGDVEKEEHVIEEWTYYLLTLGPVTILHMAELAFEDGPIGFALAKEMGWTKWAPPMYNGSRNSFLKEPVGRLYEERLAAVRSRTDPRELERREIKEISRKRVANLAKEIKLRRQTSAYKRQPFIDMYHERPMSMMSRRSSTRSQRTESLRSLSRRNSSHSESLSTAPPSVSAISSNLSPRPQSPTSPFNTPRRISPIIEDRVETFNKMALQTFGEGSAEDSSDRAVSRIVRLGFTETQAKDALRATDLGNGLRVDRAVDWLMRRQPSDD